MDVYVITIDDVYDCVNNPHTPEVYTKYEDARKSFEEWIEGERENAEENEMEVEEGKDYFETYEDGYWSHNHFAISIKKVELQ